MGIGMVMPRGKADKRAPPRPLGEPRAARILPPGGFPEGTGSHQGGSGAGGRRGSPAGDGARRGGHGRTQRPAQIPRSETAIIFLHCFFFSPLFFRWGSPASYFFASLRCAQDLTLSAVALGSDNFISQRLQNKNFFSKEISRSTHPPTQGLFVVGFLYSFFFFSNTQTKPFYFAIKVSAKKKNQTARVSVLSRNTEQPVILFTPKLSFLQSCSPRVNFSFKP